MDKRILMVIAVGGLMMVIAAFAVVNFIIKPKTERMLAEPSLTQETSGAGEALFEEEKKVPFTEKYTVIPVEGLTTNPLGSPESYFQVTIALIVNNPKFQEQLKSEAALSMIRAVLLKSLSSKRIEDLDSPEEREDLRKEIDKEIRKRITQTLGQNIWDDKGYRMEIEFVDFLIA